MINSVARSITSRAIRAAVRLLPGAGRAVLHLLQPEPRSTDVKGDTSDREPLLTPGSYRRPRVSRIPYRRRYAPSLTPSERRHAIASGSGLGRSPWRSSSPPATRYMRADGCDPDPVILALLAAGYCWSLTTSAGRLRRQTLRSGAHRASPTSSSRLQRPQNQADQRAPAGIPRPIRVRIEASRAGSSSS